MIDKHFLLYVAVFYNFGFALFHLFFWKIFNWKEDLQKLNFANRGIIQVFNVLGIFYFVFTGIICFLFQDDLVQSRLGKAFLLMNSLFWLMRFIVQFIFLRKNHWLVHTLSLVFLLGFLLFLYLTL